MRQEWEKFNVLKRYKGVSFIFHPCCHIVLRIYDTCSIGMDLLWRSL
jgi:hypothetical protein